MRVGEGAEGGGEEQEGLQDAELHGECVALLGLPTELSTGGREGALI